MLPAFPTKLSTPATVRLPRRLTSIACRCIAAAGLAASGSAYAVIASTTSTSGATTPELSLTIWDPVGKASYALDLGMTLEDLLVQGQSDSGFQRFWIIDKNTDVPFSKLRELQTATSSLEWMVFAATTGGYGGPGELRIATTLRPTATSGVMGEDYLKLQNLTTQAFNGLDGTYEQYVASLNQGGPTNQYNFHDGHGPGRPGNNDDSSINGSSFSLEGMADYVGTYNTHTLGANNILATNPVGKSSWFYYVQTDSYETTDPVLLDEFDNLSYDAYWGLAENPADGTFVLSYTMRSALPTASQLAFARAIGRTEYSGGFMSNALAGAAAASVDDRAFIAGYSRPLGAAVSPVPEPSTWALLVGGLAAVGLAARRRQRDAGPRR